MSPVIDLLPCFTRPFTQSLAGVSIQHDRPGFSSSHLADRKCNTPTLKTVCFSNGLVTARHTSYDEANAFHHGYAPYSRKPLASGSGSPYTASADVNRGDPCRGLEPV